MGEPVGQSLGVTGGEQHVLHARPLPVGQPSRAFGDHNQFVEDRPPMMVGLPDRSEGRMLDDRPIWEFAAQRFEVWFHSQ